MTEAAAATSGLPARLLPSVVGLTPSSLGRWTRCRRRYLLRDLLRLPGESLPDRSDEGLRVHALLKRLHEEGDCADARSRRDLAEAYTAAGEPERLLGFFDRHAVRCPRGAVALGHEQELARLHRTPGPPFVVAGRVDAVWIHDGILDARDYKTGAPRLDAVADDPVARAYAWLLAPLARERNLRLRLRYEVLGEGVTDDPEPFDVDDDQVAVIGDELRTTVESMRAEREFAGAAHPSECNWCEHRSICSHAVVDAIGGARKDPTP